MDKLQLLIRKNKARKEFWQCVGLVAGFIFIIYLAGLIN